MKLFILSLAAILMMPFISNAKETTKNIEVTAPELLITQGTAVVPRLSTEMMIQGNGETAQKLRSLLTNEGADSTLLRGKRIAIITTDGVEEVELTIPHNYFEARGARVDIVAPKSPVYPDWVPVQVPAVRETHILMVRYMENSGWVKIDRFMDEVRSSEYDAVIVPGGAWNPDNLRIDEDALRFLNEMNDAGKLVTAICHGPQVLINAGLLNGKNATSYWNVHVDMKNAGATVLDQPVVVDGNLITSRFPLDLPEFLEAITNSLKS